MDQLFLFIVSSVHAFISVMMFMLLIRSLLGLFSDENSKLLLFSSVVTEPIVHPVRVLLSHIPGMDESPIDFSFIATYLVLILVEYALPVSF